MSRPRAVAPIAQAAPAARAAIAAMASAVIALSPLRAWADFPRPADVEEARRHYQRGVQLYEQGSDAAALAELERAYALAPTWKVLYDVALVELAMHDVAGALRDFERYLDGGRDAVTPARRAEVERRISELRDQVATIDVGAQEGAQVMLDDVAIGVAPLAKPLVVNPGRHKLGASKEGRVADGRVVSVASGDHAKVDLTIPEPAPTPPPAPPSIVIAPPSQPPPVVVPVVPTPAKPRSYVWLGWVATGVLATGAIITGAEALSANGDLSRAKSDHPTSGADLDAISSRAHSWALVSDVLSLATVAAAGTTLYFTFRAPASAPPVAFAVAPNGLAVRGTF